MNHTRGPIRLLRTTVEKQDFFDHLANGKRIRHKDDRGASGRLLPLKQERGNHGCHIVRKDYTLVLGSPRQQLLVVAARDLGDVLSAD